VTLQKTGIKSKNVYERREDGMLNARESVIFVMDKFIILTSLLILFENLPLPYSVSKSHDNVPDVHRNLTVGLLCSVFM
jgi:hypothetical protein